MKIARIAPPKSQTRPSPDKIVARSESFSTGGRVGTRGFKDISSSTERSIQRVGGSWIPVSIVSSFWPRGMIPS